MSREFTGQDRRKNKRIKISFIVICKVNSPLSVRLMIGDREINAIALNISENGMAILANEGIPALAIITAKFILFNDYAINQLERTRSMELRAEVRYILKTREKTYRIGILFSNITAESRNFIANFIRTTAIHAYQ